MNAIRLFPLLLALFLTACGGGGGGEEAPEPGNQQNAKVLEAPMLSVLSGVVGDELPAQAGFLPAAGDSGIQKYRGILTFGLADLPPNAQIIRAVIRIDQLQVNGGPYGPLGDLILDHINTNGFFDNLNNQLYEGLALQAPIGGAIPLALSTDAVLERKSASVTNNVIDDIAAGRLRSQYRIRFEVETNNNPLDDIATFGNGVLEITYIEPSP